MWEGGYVELDVALVSYCGFDQSDKWLQFFVLLGSVRDKLEASLSVLEQGFQHREIVHLHLDAFYDVPDFTRTEICILFHRKC